MKKQLPMSMKPKSLRWTPAKFKAGLVSYMANTNLTEPRFQRFRSILLNNLTFDQAFMAGRTVLMNDKISVEPWADRLRADADLKLYFKDARDKLSPELRELMNFGPINKTKTLMYWSPSVELYWRELSKWSFKISKYGLEIYLWRVELEIDW